jgi:hypothetical protein
LTKKRLERYWLGVQVAKFRHRVPTEARNAWTVEVELNPDNPVGVEDRVGLFR